MNNLDSFLNCIFYISENTCLELAVSRHTLGTEYICDSILQVQKWQLT